MRSLKERLLLTDQGYTDLKRAIAACTLTNITLMLPFMITVMIFRELLLGITSGGLQTKNIICLWAAGIIAAIIVFFAAKNDYRKTYIASYKESNKTRENIAEHLIKLPMSFFNTRDLTEITANMMSDCSSMESMLSSTIPPLIANIISATLTCVMLAFFDWRLALCVFVTIPVAFLIILLSKKRQKALFAGQEDAKLDASARIQEYLEGIKIIKACNVTGERFNVLNDALLKLKKISVKVELAVGVFMSGASMILQSGIGITVFVGIKLFISGKTDLLTFLMFLLMVTRIYGPFLAILGQLSTLLHLDTVTERMRILERSEVMSGTDMSVSDGNIELNNVSFAYNTENVINDVSLKIEEGTVNAFVGPSGSGKSTLVKLIARFWDVGSGSIRYGGKDLRDLKPEAIMKDMAFVFQDVILFNDTVMNNIRMGNESADDEDVMNAAKAAFCDEFVSRLPDGYDTVLGENGGTLSGGERQRISIARALLKNAKIIILDEATASLDPENEYYVQQAIARLVKGKTVIMIAHRLKTVVDADRIFVLSDGKLIQEGTHDELMSEEGVYKSLYSFQNT